uniref:KIB1-4 beta-propeller domain-containing protein n=1 Tax=Oryza punctata TaxID=4537 RepID=A0A0E0M6X7_ORYPU
MPLRHDLCLTLPSTPTPVSTSVPPTPNPAELLGVVSGCLTSNTDVLHIHQVCAHWRASTAPLAAGWPWIMANHGRHTLSVPSTRTTPSRSPMAMTARITCFGDALAELPYCYGNPRGWLALADAPHSPTRLVLWEPVSKAEIMMPPLHREIFLASSPSPEWMAIVGPPFSIVGKWQMLFFWCPGDAAWTPQHEPPSDRMHSAAFHGRFFYFNVRAWYLHAYDLHHHDAPWPPARACSTFVYFDTDPAHVVANGDDLLLVVLYWECHRRSVHMVELEKKWRHWLELELTEWHGSN